MKTYEMVRRLPSYRNYGKPPLSVAQMPGYSVALAVTLLAFTIRWAFDAQLPPGFPYVTFFPALVFTAFVAGIWPGILSAFLGMMLSWYFFIPPVHSFELNSNTATALVFYVAVAGIDIALMKLALNAFANVDRMANENKKMSDFQALLIRELDHRIKNLFSVVSAVVKLTAREVETPAELAEAASARIMALGRSHSALWQVGQDSTSTVEGVARQVLEPFLLTHSGQITITGETKLADIRHVQIITLIIHELATNSAKYGTLNSRNGGISIGGEQSAGSVRVNWVEDGIETMPQPSAGGGFGTEMISRLVASAGGRFERIFEDHMLRASAVLPAV